MFFRKNMRADERLALLLNLGQLPLQSEGEVQPIGQVESVFAYALNRPVVAGAVPIIVFAESEQPLKIVALAIDTTADPDV